MTMVLAHNVASYFPERVSVYVPDLHYHSDVDQSGLMEVNLPALLTLDADGIVDGQALTGGGTLLASQLNTLFDQDNPLTMGPYGRNVTAVGGGTTTSTITVHGRDYLNQPMSETLTLADTAAQTGVKCFKYIDKVVFSATSAVTFDLGWGSSYGLPLKTLALIHELVSLAAPTAGSITKAVETDPQTAILGDPRGRYIPHSGSVANGTRTYQLVVRVDRNNLHGVPHFFSG